MRFYILAHQLPKAVLTQGFSSFFYGAEILLRWRDEGLLQVINNSLVMAVRERENKQASPTAGVIASQSVKTTESGGIRGFDADEKINGHKRHIVVDTLGLIAGLVVQSAGIQNRDGALYFGCSLFAS